MLSTFGKNDEISNYTSNRGISPNIYMKIYGKFLTTRKIKLSGFKTEQSQSNKSLSLVEIFEVKTQSIGDIQKIKYSLFEK
jgi:hypothetical protein